MLSELIQQYQDGDEDAIIKMFEDEEFIKTFETQKFFVKKYMRCNDNVAMSIVYEALPKALRRYDPKKNDKFGPYFSWWVRSQMNLERCRRASNGIFADKHKTARDAFKVRRYLQDNPNATKEEMSEKLNIKEKMVVTLMNCIDEPSDVILDNVTVDFDFGADCFEEYDKLYDAIQTLEEKDQYIILMRYGMFDTDKLTLAEVADLSGCTAENIRQRQLKIEKKLRKQLKM
jgi:RNA polymerase sigma factor (sigma-70 family)